VQSNLQFSIHEASGHVIVKVIDTETDEVIRQIPSEAILALAENAERLYGGKVLDEQV
jgi:flagellar protein FlaG